MKKFSENDVKKALEQAQANIDFEEVIIPLEKREDKTKVFRKDLNNGRIRPS